MVYSALIISASSSVPKIADIWDIGLHDPSTAANFEISVLRTKDAMDQRGDLCKVFVMRCHRRLQHIAYPVPLNVLPAAK